VTFDDGWQDVYENAFGVLLEYKIPAVIFLPSGSVGSYEGVGPEKVLTLIQGFMEKKQALNDPEVEAINRCLRSRGIEFRFSAEGKLGEGNLYQLVKQLKELPPGEFEGLYQDLKSIARGKRQGLSQRVMTWEEIKTMAHSGIHFGSHSVSHQILTGLPKPELTREIVESKTLMEEHLGQIVKAFAYPDGRYNAIVAAKVSRAGYRCAFTTDPGLVKISDNPFSICRINVHEDVTCTPELFACELLGVFRFLRK